MTDENTQEKDPAPEKTPEQAEAEFKARVDAVMKAHDADTLEIVQEDGSDPADPVFRLLKDNKFVAEGTMSQLELAAVPVDGSDAPTVSNPDQPPPAVDEAVEEPAEVEAEAPPAQRGLTSEPENA